MVWITRSSARPARARDQAQAGRVGRRRGRRAVVDDELDRAPHRVGQGRGEGHHRRGQARGRRRHVLHDRVHRERRARHGRVRDEGARPHHAGRDRRPATVHDPPVRLPVRRAERELSIGFQQKIGAGLFGGEGFILQKVGGTGDAWVELDGEIVEYELRPVRRSASTPATSGCSTPAVAFEITASRASRTSSSARTAVPRQAHRPGQRVAADAPALEARRGAGAVHGRREQQRQERQRRQDLDRRLQRRPVTKGPAPSTSL